MRKKLVYFILGLTGAAAVPATHAQTKADLDALASTKASTSFAFYGILDNGVARISDIGGGGSTQLRSGSLYSSRFGVHGIEDLSGDLRAVFNLEAGLSTATPFFNRQSWVGMHSTTSSNGTQNQFSTGVIHGF